MAILKKITCFILIAIGGVFLSSAQTPSREYQLKAAFIFNFTQFVEWPPQAFPTAQSPAVIGIIGTNPFGTFLEETIKGEMIGKHPLIVKHFDNVDQITNCQVLFINISDKATIQTVITKLKGKNVLTISDANKGFAKFGGMIRLYTKSEKISMQINLEATKAEKLVLSSKLLKLAEIVKTDK